MDSKPALGNSPVDCCNRRGVSAEKRVHFGPPLQKERKRSGGLAQLGERLPCKQEVSGSIPLISTTKERLTEVANERKNVRSFIESLAKEAQTCTLKTEHCELLMQL